MKRTKKFAVAALILMLFAALAVPASAETVQGKNDKSIDVKAKYAGGATTTEVYSVDVTWGKMEFTYSVSGTREWDPATHKYTDNTSPSWTAEGNDVVVVNHSNMPINVDFAYASDENYGGVTGEFSVTSDTLDAGVVNDVDGADSVSTKLTLSGTLASSVTEFTKVGSITVSIN